MATQAKPSGWQSLDLDDARRLFEVDLLYEGGVAGLVALASPTAPKAAKELDRILREIIGTFRVDLHFEGRPTIPQVRAALRKSPLAAARDWLVDLDPNTRRVLADEAHWPVPDLQRENPDVTGEERLATLLAELERGVRWLRRAEARLMPGNPGRHRRDSVHDAVERLRVAWMAANGRDPKLSTPEVGRTTGPFLDFVRAVLSPPLQEAGVKAMNLENAVRTELYGP